MVQLHQDHPDDVAAISLNLDYTAIDDQPADYVEDVAGFLTTIDAGAIDNIVAGDSFDSVMMHLECDAVPVVLVIGRDGELLKRFNGEDYENNIAPFVKTVLRKEAESPE